MTNFENVVAEYADLNDLSYGESERLFLKAIKKFGKEIGRTSDQVVHMINRTGKAQMDAILAIVPIDKK